MKNVLKDSINNRLEEKGYTQSSLSKKTGLSRSQIHKTLNITDNPGIYTVAKIANALNCSIDDLMGNSHKNKKQDYVVENPSLLKLTVDYISKDLISKNISFTINQFLDSVDEIYSYSLKASESDKVDLRFATWYIDSKFY